MSMKGWFTSKCMYNIHCMYVLVSSSTWDDQQMRKEEHRTSPIFDGLKDEQGREVSKRVLKG